MFSAIKPVVLCGGSGTRLWPLSTPDHPKQFLDLLGGDSMLEMTLKRVRETSDNGLQFKRPLIVGAARHGALMEQYAEAADILLEPVGRNSAPPVAAAALVSDPDDLLLVLPADHDIADLPAFHQAISTGLDAARAGAVVTFGVVARSPATGYGYIETEENPGDVAPVVRFVEKPDLETAKQYVASGRFFWNAGIFLFRAGAMLEAFKTHAPDILDAVAGALPDAGALNGKSFQHQLDVEAFSDCRSESLDYAIIENLADLQVVPVEMGWNDVGDFKALWDISKKDESGNVVVGNATLINSRNCYVRASGPAISISGQENAIIISTGTNFLVCSMSSAQSVKQLAGK